MPPVYARRYLAKALASAPRDLINTVVARFRPLLPTVLVFNCTFVCDARCLMCSNWRRGSRKEDLTIEEIRRVFEDPFWRAVETVGISGGEPTTRPDLVELCQVLLDRLPRLRKLGINTTGHHPSRAVPMLTRVIEACEQRGVIFSTRVSIDGIGEMHDVVRNTKGGFDRAVETLEQLRALQRSHRFGLGVSTTVFAHNLDDAENILAWARRQQLDIVFNMVRFTEPMLGNATLASSCKPMGPQERRMREFFLERVRLDPLLDGQNYIYMHYADMIANGYRRRAPCPFQTQGVMLNPDGALFYCENGRPIGNVRDQSPADLYFKAISLAHRNEIRREICPTCLSPCQMNVAAIKQVVPYVRFLARAWREKRRHRGARRPAA